MERQTHTYKTVDGRALEADVIGARPGESRPGVVWIHGGGLIFGWRKTSPRPSLVQALLDRGLVVISIDHRLAPETKLDAIVGDVHDAWRWVHGVGPGLFGVDRRRMTIAGASAGGYLSLMAGYLFEPRPCAVASLFGYGDITAAWEVEPSQHYRTMDLISYEDAMASLSAPPMQDPALGIDRSIFYLYCRQQGRWLQEVTAHDPVKESPWFDRYCPIRNLTAAYPPTLLVHGTDDTDVPHDESAKLASRMTSIGVEHRFVSLPGVGHGFAGAPREVVEATEKTVAAFLAEKC